MVKSDEQRMDIEKIKLLIRSMELVIDSLKAEIYLDTTAYKIDDIDIEDLNDYEEIV